MTDFILADLSTIRQSANTNSPPIFHLIRYTCTYTFTIVVSSYTRYEDINGCDKLQSHPHCVCIRPLIPYCMRRFQFCSNIACLFRECSATAAVTTSCTGSFTETVLPEAQSRFRKAPSALSEYANPAFSRSSTLHILRLRFGV